MIKRSSKLYKEFKVHKNIKMDQNNFIDACFKGYLEMVKYLWIISNGTINLLFLKQKNIHSNVKNFINSIKKN